MKKFDDIFPKDFLVTVQQNIEDSTKAPGFFNTMRKFYPKEGFLKNYEEREKLKSENESNLKESQPK